MTTGTFAGHAAINEFGAEFIAHGLEAGYVRIVSANPITGEPVFQVSDPARAVRPGRHVVRRGSSRVFGVPTHSIPPAALKKMRGKS